MSLTITVRASDAKTGGDNHELPADGDNGNQEIDTKAEAEAALTYVTDDKNVAVVGEKTYKRAELIAIRDKNTAAVKAEGKVEGEVPSPDAKPATVRGSGVSIGVGVDGYYLAGLGDNGHSGGGAQLTGRFGIPLFSDRHLLDFDIIAGGDVGHFGKDYGTPGGEPINSSFTGGGLVAGVGLRYTSPWLFSVGLGLLGEVGGFGTADSTTVSLPTSCTPGDDSGFGRGECEPNAGAKTGNAGTTGLYNPDLSAARGTGGVMVGVDIPLTVGVRAAEGEWGGLDIVGGAKFNYKYLAPGDGHGFGFPSFGGFLGVQGHFGGADAVVPSKPTIEDKDGDGVEDSKDKCPGTLAGVEVGENGCEVTLEDKDKDGVGDKDDKCPDVAGTKENGGCPDFAASVTSAPESVRAEEKFLVGLNVGSSSKVRISFKDAAGVMNNSNSVLIEEGNSKSEFSTPAGLKSGKYKLVITFEDMATHVKKTEERDIVIVENVTGDMPSTFPPNQKPFIKDLKVTGMEKLEGVSYEITGVENNGGKQVGTVKSTAPVSIEEAKPSQVIFQTAPETKGFRKDVKYTVTFRNKDGLVILTKEFEVGEAPPPPPAPKGGGGRKRL